MTLPSAARAARVAQRGNRWQSFNAPRATRPPVSSAVEPSGRATGSFGPARTSEPNTRSAPSQAPMRAAVNELRRRERAEATRSTGRRLEARVRVAVALHEASLDRGAVEPLARDLDPRIALAARESTEPARRDGLRVLAPVARLEPDIRRAREAPVRDRAVFHRGGHPAVGAGEVCHLCKVVGRSGDPP